MKEQIRTLRVLCEENTSARETIKSIKGNSKGIVFTFRKSLSLDVNWCLDEVLMLARQAKIKLKKDQVKFWRKGNQLLVPYQYGAKDER